MKFTHITGYIGMLACVIVLISHFYGLWAVEDHNAFAETISKLAIGDKSWIMDWGLVAFSVGLTFVALGLMASPRDEFRWRVGSALILLQGMIIVLIALHNQYQDSGTPKDNIHIELVYGLYAFQVLACFLLHTGFGDWHPTLQRLNLWLGVGWTVLAPFFFVVPDSFDGLYERVIAGILIAWIALVSYFLQRGEMPSHEESELVG